VTTFRFGVAVEVVVAVSDVSDVKDVGDEALEVFGDQTIRDWRGEVTAPPSWDRVAPPTAGDVAGEVTGDVAGDVAGDITGDVAGDVARDMTGERGAVILADSWSCCSNCRWVCSRGDAGIDRRVGGGVMGNGGALVLSLVDGKKGDVDGVKGEDGKKGDVDGEKGEDGKKGDAEGVKGEGWAFGSDGIGGNDDIDGRRLGMLDWKVLRVGNCVRVNEIGSGIFLPTEVPVDTEAIKGAELLENIVGPLSSERGWNSVKSGNTVVDTVVLEDVKGVGVKRESVVGVKAVGVKAVDVNGDTFCVVLNDDPAIAASNGDTMIAEDDGVEGNAVDVGQTIVLSES